SPRSVEAKLFVDSLVERAKLIREGKVQPRDDNMLAVTTDGRKAALDMRLIFGGVEYDEESKVGACLRSIRRIWSQTVSFRGAQIVFCDMSSPKAGRAFSVYDDMRERLVASGIPESEIAFIHDADSDTQKAKLFKAVRDGRVRVIFGSTGKMGIGTNVQTRLCALHHLDAPWRPCDVEQREGRILRQGNTCVEVEIYRYVTEGSFDAYIWQTLETKARFIAQVMKGDKGIRALEDVELAALSYAEVKALASGNPMVIEKAGVDADVARLSTLFSVWRNQRYANESEVSRLPATLDSLDARIAAYAEDCKQLKPQAIDNFVVQIGKVSYVGAEDAGNALRDVVKSVASEIKVAATAIEKVIGSFGGFELGVYASKYKELPNFFVKGKGVYHANPYQAGAYLVTALLDTLESIRRHHSSAIS
ncbi:MAG TPA: DEAD/DEAH box helicase, partial [Burkholderiaceae bacterium]|nr:DEAD/DEAH box helicase [Burkholderiaceae bacterium]